MNRVFTSLVQKAGAGALGLIIAATVLCSIVTSTVGQALVNSTSPKTTSQLETAQTNSQGQTAAQKYFTDVVLVNQNGEKMRFYSDLLHDKVVIINSFFPLCKPGCLPMNRNLEKVQEALGDHIGKDVYIVSISVDPTVDTPASLNEYAKKLNARRGWYFLTGEKQNV